MQDIQNAASEENMDIVVPAHLNRIDRVSVHVNVCKHQG